MCGQSVTEGCWVRWWWGVRGTVPARAGKLGRGSAFALCARGGLDRFQCLLRPGPACTRGLSVVGVRWDRRGVGPTYLHKRGHSRLFLVMRDRLQIGVCGHSVTGDVGCVGGGAFAGPCLRAQGSSGDDWLLRCARGGGLDRLQCLLRPGPVGTRGLSVVGRSRDRVCARREARERIGFRAVREGWVDRFQCLLRPIPLVPGESVVGETGALGEADSRLSSLFWCQ